MLSGERRFVTRNSRAPSQAMNLPSLPTPHRGHDAPPRPSSPTHDAVRRGDHHRRFEPPVAPHVTLEEVARVDAQHRSVLGKLEQLDPLDVVRERALEDAVAVLLADEAVLVLV